jgi:hypothetical protein
MYPSRDAALQLPALSIFRKRVGSHVDAATFEQSTSIAEMQSPTLRVQAHDAMGSISYISGNMITRT